MPSKSRGLRTSTGCLTCRRRRVKCDEGLPECKNCKRVQRDCSYPEDKSTSRRPRTLSARKSRETSETQAVTEPNTLPISENPAPSSGPEAPVASADPTASWLPFPTEQWNEPINVLPDESFFLDDSLFTFGDAMSNNFGPVEWYDLLAEDFQGQTQNSRWDFDITSLSRRQSPRQSLIPVPPGVTFEEADPRPLPIVQKPWNTEKSIELKREEVIHFEHFINVVAPILDLFDPGKHFANVVPHLALHNVGLLKSLLAVGACHMSMMEPQQQSTEDHSIASPNTLPSIASVKSATGRIAEQYYYETLQYLSQNLLYQAYTTSYEILATATMISTYEMYGTASNSDHSNWDRHLRGAFWIQKTMGASGECSDGLLRAIWWAWLRQDIWAAFRTGRPALTIHQPKVPMSALSSDELATRVIYIAAKCVQFAATPKEGDIAGYIDAGQTLMRMLDTWKRYLPPSFEPIDVSSSSVSSGLVGNGHHTAPIWIHPPAHAAAIQMYHFARIIMILNQPSTGGLNMYQTRFRLLRESTDTICGIAVAQQAQNLPTAFVSFQALYAAALCAETQDRQSEILAILEKVLNVGKFPSKSILGDLVNVWSGAK